MKHSFICLLLIAALGLPACGGRDEPAPEPAPAPPPQTNRIDVPPAVRQNLGITFAEVQRRPVRQTLRVPGSFELLPEARRETRAMVAGRVQLLVRQFEQVEPDEPLAELDSPEWRQRQHAAVEAEGEIKLARAAVAIAEADVAQVETRLQFTQSRLGRLSDAGVRRVELEGQLAELQAQLPNLQAQLRAAHVRLEEAEEHYASILNVLASLAGMPKAALLAPVESEEGIVPHWRTLSVLTLHAEAAGVVDRVAVSHGGWVETGNLILSTVDPSMLRFHAEAPQADLPRLRDGQRARIVPPEGPASGARPLNATVAIGLEAHAQERTLPLYASPDALQPWARPGVAAYLEIYTAGESDAQLAIPVASLVQDDLRTIFYRRDPRNPDQVYPVEADLGESDGRWVVVRSGVTDGDEVVLDGAYAINLSGSRPQAPPGYHYHADGSLHRDH